MLRTIRNNGRRRGKRSEALLTLLRERGRDMVTFAICVLVSSGFWLLQKLDDAFEADITVPLVLSGVPKGVVVTDSLPRSVTVTIRDRGTNLLHYMRQGKQVNPIVLDFSMYDNGGASGRAHVPLQDVQKAFQQQILSTTHVQRLRPDTLEFYYNRGRKRKLPVKFCGTINTDRQCYLQYVSFEPDSVVVYAPDAVRDTMQFAYIKAVNIKGVSKTMSRTVQFVRKPGVLYKPASTKLTAHIDYYTEKTVTVPVRGLNFPAGVALRTFPAEVKITYRTGAAVADLVKPSSFVLAVTYEELLRNNRGKYMLHLKSLPPGVSNVRIIPHEVDYLLEVTGSESE